MGFDANRDPLCGHHTKMISWDVTGNNDIPSNRIMTVVRHDDGVHVDGIEGAIGKGNKVMLDVERSS